MKPTTISNRARGIAIGNPDRFKGSTVYDEVRDLPYTKGSGLELDEKGGFHWLGNSKKAYDALLDELVKKAGLTGEEGSTLWAFLDHKRRNVWYVKGQKRTPESHADEESTMRLSSFEFNNLTVVLKNGWTLEHFMAVHYGTNEFSWDIWPRHAEWMKRPQVKEVPSAPIPDLNVGDVPEDIGAAILHNLKMELLSRCPTLVNPDLAKKKYNARYERSCASLELGVEEDLTAADEMRKKTIELATKRG